MPTDAGLRWKSQQGGVMTSDNRALAHEGLDDLNDQIHAAVLGKAYIAVLKHRLANPTEGKSARQIFDEAYSAALKMAGQSGTPAQ